MSMRKEMSVPIGKGIGISNEMNTSSNMDQISKDMKKKDINMQKGPKGSSDMKDCMQSYGASL